MTQENQSKPGQGELLAHIAMREYHRGLGFSDLCAYAVSRGVSDSERKVKDLAGLKKGLQSLPGIRAAYEAGALEWTKARTIAAVATAADEDVWLEAGLAKSNRKLEALVRAARGLPPIEKLIVDLTLEQRTWFDRAALGVRQRHGRELTNADALETLCRESLQGGHGDSDDQSGEGDADGTKDEAVVSAAASDSAEVECSAKASDSAVTGNAEGRAKAEGTGRPAARRRRGAPSTRIVLHRCEDCVRSTLEGRDGPVVVSEATYAQELCNAEVLDIRKGPGRVTRTVPPRIANYIHARDHGRCQVRGCRNVGFLHVHHEGGRGAVGHDPDLMLLACFAHHQAVHRGHIKISGRWPRFEFSLADGTPLGAPLAGAPHVGSADRSSPGVDAFSSLGHLPT